MPCLATLPMGKSSLFPASSHRRGARIFQANWTIQDGAGRPRTKGNGQPLSDPTSPLSGARARNRISGPGANSCMGCHNAPYGIPGRSGDFAAGVFVLGQRFDFATFDRGDTVPTERAGMVGKVPSRQSPIPDDATVGCR